MILSLVYMTLVEPYVGLLIEKQLRIFARKSILFGGVIQVRGERDGNPSERRTICALRRGYIH
jgi:hypothetical protein